MIAEALRKLSRNLKFATSRFKRNKRHSSICVGLSAISPQLRLSAPGGCVFCCIFRTGVVAVSRAAHVQDMWTPGHPVTSYIGCLLEKEHPEGDGMVMKTQAALSICQCT